MLRNTKGHWKKQILSGALALLMLLGSTPQPVLAAAGALGGKLRSSAMDAPQTQAQTDAPQNYRWEVLSGALATIPGFGNQLNAPAKLSGSVSGSTINNGHYQLSAPVVLRHDRTWVLEWKGAGNWGGMLFSSCGTSNTAGVEYLYRSASSGLIAFGEYQNGQYHNYGVALSGLDMSAVHTYRLENRLHADGTNMVYLVVDGVERGAMNNYYIGGSSNQNKTVDWVNGKDFTFSYISGTQHLLMNLNLEYIQVWENGSAFDDLTISILGDSISTYAGVSNNTSYNPTLAGGAIYYNPGKLGVYREDTWWQQTADRLGMEVLVNNSWSGSAMFNFRSNTVGAYQDRCVQLHNTAGEDPDIIAFYLGTNDFSDFMGGKCALGTADIDYDALITKTDAGYTYATPTTVCEAYAIALHKTSVRYPDAEIYCLTPLRRIGQSATRIAQAKQFSEAIKALAAQRGAYAVDLYEDSGIKADAFFSKYVTDNSLHPGPLGMDAITGCLISSILENSKYASAELCNVTYDLSDVMVEQGTVPAAQDDSSFGCSFVAPANYVLSVTVTMDGKDITSAAYADGKVTIPKVTGDIVITASSRMPEKDPMVYRWEFDGADLSSVGSSSNALTRLGGSVSNGVHSNSRYRLAENIVLYHDRAWVLEWKSEGAWTGTGSGALLFSGGEVSATTGSYYLYRRQNSDLIALGTYTGSSYLNYGVVLSQHNIDGTAEHIYRLENRIAKDGSNMVWLYVDGTEVGPMNQYFVGGTNQNTTSNTLSGRDFVFTHMGTSAHPINNCSIEYLQVWEGERSFSNKTISILGDSISTYAGVSNNTAYNSTIGKNAIYYRADGSTQKVSQADTWWQQTIDALDMKLLVNNSWSGSAVLHTRSGAAGAYVDRCIQLHNDHTGENPDVIAVFMGTNDFSYHQSALGTADINYDTLITANGDGSFTYATPTTTCEAYAIMLHKMTVRYPDAEIYCLTMLPRRADDHDNKDVVPQPTAFNAELVKIIRRFGCAVVDLEHCGIPTANEEFDRYITDQRVHPGPKGMDKMTEALVSALLGQETKTYSVSGIYTGTQTDNTAATVIEGKEYSANLDMAGGYSDLKVTVTMGGEDVTETAYANGTVHIETVTGDIVITATAQRKPLSFRWKYSNGDLVSTGDTENLLTKLAGTTTDGMLSNTRYQLDKQVVLRHDLPWMLEWSASGSWSGMILSAKQTSSAAGNTYIFKTTSNTGLVAFGESVNNQYQNYGVSLAAKGVDTTTKHTYRLINQPAADGTNMVYLWVDDVNYGAVNQYHIGATSQGTTANWVSGKDFTFSYIGANGHAINNCVLEYIQVWEGGCSHSYESVVTAPTCTERGYTTHTCTICGDSYVDSYADALGHDYDAAVTYPDGLRSGWTDYTCSRCADSFRTAWLDEKAYQGMTIACVGDSITAAVGVTKDQTDYVKRLADLLGVNYIRLGVSGTTLCTGGSRTCNIGKLTESNLNGADVVTIALGINDFCAAGPGYYALGDINSTDSSTIYGAARMWCERIVELRKTDSLRDTQFYFVTPVIASWNNSVTSARNWDQSKTNIHGYTLRDLCNAIIEMAALYDVAVIDLNLLSGMYYVDETDNNTAVFGGDGVHPGATGHAMMAAAMANVLLQNDLRDDHTHTMGSWITSSWPSCVSGEEQRVCTICSATESRTAESDDAHAYTSVVTPPTCTEQGYTTHTCTICGDSYVDSYVPATGHSFTAYVSDGNATLYADGTKTALCDYGCGTKDTVTDAGSMRFPEQVTSNVYDITGSILGKVPAGTTVETLLSGLDWGKYCKVFGANGQVSGGELVGTGMVLKLMDGETVKQDLTIVVIGDTSGDGLITITDFTQVKAHLLQKTLLTGAFATAADLSGDGALTLTDFVQLKNRLQQ